MVDIKLKLGGKQHDVKIKVYNTMCSMDFQAPGNKAKQEHEHLENMTVGKYFAKKVMPSLIDKICLDPTIDLEVLNEEWRVWQLRDLLMKGNWLIEQRTTVQCVKSLKEIKIHLNVTNV